MEHSLDRKLAHEIRRGNVILAVLSGLQREKYGYELLKFLRAKGLWLEQDVLYPLLRRLELQGYLQGRWRVKEERPRRYYKLTPAGEHVLEEMRKTTQEMQSTLESIYQEDAENGEDH